MPDCELSGGCPFFNDHMKGVDTVKDILKEKYCRQDKSGCARYMVFKALGRPKVPADLIPNQVDWAQQIISSWYA